MSKSKKNSEELYQVIVSNYKFCTKSATLLRQITLISLEDNVWLIYKTLVYRELFIRKSYFVNRNLYYMEEI
jgi:hypothetical protein